jgi:hypothetical protein
MAVDAFMGLVEKTLRKPVQFALNSLPDGSDGGVCGLT